MVMAMDRNQIIAVVFVVTGVLLTIAIIRGARSGATALQILDETLIGFVALLAGIAILVPRVRFVTGTVSSLLFLRFLWTTLRRIRSENRSQPK
jgi:hypothetical protein